MNNFVSNILKDAEKETLNEVGTSGFNVLVQLSKDISSTTKNLILKRLDNGYTYNYNVFNGEINSEVKTKELIEKFNTTLTDFLTRYKMKDGYKIIIKNVLPSSKPKFIRPSSNTEIAVIKMNPTTNKPEVVKTEKMKVTEINNPE